MCSSRVRVRIRVRSVWLVSCYAYVFVLIKVVIVTLQSAPNLAQFWWGAPALHACSCGRLAAVSGDFRRRHGDSASTVVHESNLSTESPDLIRSCSSRPRQRRTDAHEPKRSVFTFFAVICFACRARQHHYPQQDVEPGMGVFRGGRPPPIEEFFALLKYSLSSFFQNHMYNLCRIAW